MKSGTKKDTKKSRGRPATGVGFQIGTRWSPAIVGLVDEWRGAQDDLPGRPEAIRRLVELGLKVKPKGSGRKPASEAPELLASLTVGAPDTEERSAPRRRLAELGSKVKK
jgi:hypothetical protein